MEKRVALVLIIVLCAGCGGGGGGGGAQPGQTLSLNAGPPDTAGKAGQVVTLPVTVMGSGSVFTADFEVTFNDGVFEPAVTLAGDDSSSIAMTGLPEGTACRYKWVDSHTIKVLFASAEGIASGATLITIPMKVKAEGSSGLQLANTLVNH